MGSRLVALHEASQNWVWRWLYVAAVPWLALAAWGSTLGVVRLAVYGGAFFTFLAWLALVTNGAYFFVFGLALLAVLGIGFLRPGFAGLEDTRSRAVVGGAGVAALIVAASLFSPTPTDPDIAAQPTSPVADVAPEPNTTLVAPTTTSSVPPNTTTTIDPADVAPILLRVIDGDTIKVLVDGEEESVRLIGIDANEPGDCLASEATARLSELVAGGFELERDVTNRDRFGRLLRYVIVNGEPVSLTLAAEGLAIARRYPPDIAFAEALELTQEEAQSAGLGIWDPSSCGSGEPLLVLSEDSSVLEVFNVGSGTLDLGGVAVVAGSQELVTFDSWFALLPGEVVEVRSRCGDNTGRVVFACAGGLWPTDVALALVGSGVAFAELPAATTTSTTTSTTLIVAASPSDVVISYIHPDADGNDNQSANKNDEYFDLANEGDTDLSMLGWKVEDEGPNHTYRFPNSYSLAAGATVRIHTGCGANDAEHLYWCKGGSAVWNNDGDTVTLIGPDGAIVDTWGY